MLRILYDTMGCVADEYQVSGEGGSPLDIYCNYSNSALYICLVGDPSDPSYGFLSRERTCFSPNHFFTANGTSLGALQISKVTLVHSLDGKGSLHLAALPARLIGSDI